jgi:hypothetical protein
LFGRAITLRARRKDKEENFEMLRAKAKNQKLFDADFL